MDPALTFLQRLEVLRSQVRNDPPRSGRNFTDRIARAVAEHMSLPPEVAASDLPWQTPPTDPELLIACHLAVVLAWDLAESTIWRERYDLLREYESRYPTAEALESDPDALVAGRATLQFIDGLIERIRSRAPIGVPPASGYPSSAPAPVATSDFSASDKEADPPRTF